MGNIAIIIVTHNSDFVVQENIKSLMKSGIRYEQLIILDSGSDDIRYLHGYESIPKCKVYYEKNIGFCKGNNIGYSKLESDIEFVLFLNPDVIITENFFPILLEKLKGNVFAVSPILKRYIIDNDKVKFTENIDSNGITSTFYGKYYDLKNKIASQYYSADALCGAFILCRKSILDKILIDNKVFDERMYMYKEDIELGIRAGAKGYENIVCQNVFAYHGRGWKERSKISKWQKKLSSKNEFYLLAYMKYPRKAFSFIYYVIKYMYVRFIERG